MADTQAEPKLLLPQLKPFYEFAIPLAWPVIRIACGWNLLVHGWGKVTRGPSAFVKALLRHGLRARHHVGVGRARDRVRRRHRADSRAVHALLGRRRRDRDGGHPCLYWNNGFAWLARGYEYMLLWGLVCFAIALRGGGPYSLDRKLGKEL